MSINGSLLNNLNSVMLCQTYFKFDFWFLALADDLIQLPADYEKSDLQPKSVSKKVSMKIGMFGDILSRKTVIIECPTKGSVEPKFTWLLFGEEIKSNGKYKAEGRFLTILNQEAGDYEITCRAETFLGRDEMKSNLRFVGEHSILPGFVLRLNSIAGYKAFI